MMSDVVDQSRPEHLSKLAGDARPMMKRATAFAFAAIACIFFCSTYGLAASVERNGQKWEAVRFDELYDSSFAGLFSNDVSILAGEPIVTSGTIRNCLYSNFVPVLAPPSGNFFHMITIYPQYLYAASGKLPLDKGGHILGAPYEGPSTTTNQYWSPVPGYGRGSEGLRSLQVESFGRRSRIGFFGFRKSEETRQQQCPSRRIYRIRWLCGWIY